MSVGLEWYKREPVAYLKDVQGLSAKEHAVYSVVLDLIYIHGGDIPNDPKWISGWIGDMGAAAVRTALASLAANPRITIIITDASISQIRAKSEVKTKKKQRENSAVSGRIGGERSAETRRAIKENNTLDEANASLETQAEKRREEKREDPYGSSMPHKRGKRLPDDWTLPREWGDWALGEGWPEPVIREEAAKFRDHWIAKSGRDAAKLDWQATWRNWMRNAKKGNHINGRTYDGQAADIAQRAAERWAERQATRNVGRGPGPGASQPLLPAGQPRRGAGNGD